MNFGSYRNVKSVVSEDITFGRSVSCTRLHAQQNKRNNNTQQLLLGAWFPWFILQLEKIILFLRIPCLRELMSNGCPHANLQLCFKIEIEMLSLRTNDWELSRKNSELGVLAMILLWVVPCSMYQAIAAVTKWPLWTWIPDRKDNTESSQPLKNQRVAYAFSRDSPPTVAAKKGSFPTLSVLSKEVKGKELRESKTMKGAS